jgi:aerotolerance regulator-like protein
MGALNPVFLFAGAAIGVPIFLHLFQRHQTRRLSFPALRYLERTEREHARRIRLRQLLLLLARVVILLLVVGAGARLVFLGRGGSHPPTAVVVILDNSMSSGLVVGEVRVLDRLQAVVNRTLGAASDEDRFWIIRAGEPWLPAVPGGADEARAAVEEADVSDAAGDLTAALERAARLLTASDLERGEIHMLSDLQRTAFTRPDERPAGEIPVVVWRGREEPSVNRALTGVVVGGGLPPLEGQRTEVTVSALESSTAADTAHVPVRLVVNERIRGAASLPPGSQTAIAMPPSGSGWIRGYADADPDRLRADDRRFFAYRSRRAPTVSLGGAPGVFVAEALAVLEGAGRVRTTVPGAADLLVAQNGTGLDQRAPNGAVLVIPPDDPTLLPALNRRLADAGIPWRLEVRSERGEAELGGSSLPAPLERVLVRAWFDLRLAGDPAGPTRTLAEVGGRPWAVEGTDVEGRRYLVLASPMESGATTLPVSTGMLRFVDWAASEWAGAGGVVGKLIVGDDIPAPSGATHVRFPKGSVYEIDGRRTVRGTGEAGFYTFLAADTTVSIVALNPPAAESRLTRLDPDDFESAIGDEVIVVDGEDGWDSAVYRTRQGPELWWPFLLGVMVLLLIEALMATSGEGDERRFRKRADPASAIHGAH